MRYLTAILGALFMFAATFVLSALVVPFLPDVFRTEVTIGMFHTNNPLGLLLGSLAATASFHSTLRLARAKDAERKRRASGGL
jgi:hypothetical protein